VYFRDSGLLCFLLNLDEETLPTSPMMGSVWETFLFSEMRKQAGALSGSVKFWYYRDQRGREIDIVIERGGLLSFVECKWQEHPGKEDARHLMAVHKELVAAKLDWRPGRHYVIGTPESTYQIAAGLTAGALRDIPRVLGERKAAGV
jgi:predicted AAA+ superfamily ATPase